MAINGLRLDLIILDCPDALVLGQFYAEITGWAVEEGSDAGFTTLARPAVG